VRIIFNNRFTLNIKRETLNKFYDTIKKTIQKTIGETKKGTQKANHQKE